MEQLEQQLFVINEAMDQLNLEDTIRSERLEGWMGHVEETLDCLVHVPAGDIAGRHRPWEL